MGRGSRPLDSAPWRSLDLLEGDFAEPIAEGVAGPAAVVVHQEAVRELVEVDHAVLVGVQLVKDELREERGVGCCVRSAPGGRPVHYAAVVAPWCCSLRFWLSCTGVNKTG